MLMNNKLVFYLCISLAMSNAVWVEGYPARCMHLEIENNRCLAFTKMLLVFECKHYQSQPDVHLFTDRVVFAKDMPDQFEVRLQIKGQHMNTKIIVPLLDMRLDICANLRHAFRNPILRVVMEEMRRVSTLPYECPIKAHHEYKLNNFTLTKDVFPPYASSGNFTIIIDFYYKNTLIGRQTTTGGIYLVKNKRKC